MEPKLGESSEMHFTTTGPSGWHTPENVAKMIDELPGAIERMIQSTQASQAAAIKAAQVMHSRVTIVAGVVAGGVVVASLLGVWNGNSELAERLLIPLISFAGGFGLASRVPAR